MARQTNAVFTPVEPVQVRLIKTPKVVLLCGKCGDMLSFKPFFWAQCTCGNMAARFKTKARLEVEVIAVHKHLAKIIEPKVLLSNHWALIRKVGEGNTAWAPVIQKQIDECGMLVSDFTKKRKRRKVVRESTNIIRLAV